MFFNTLLSIFVPQSGCLHNRSFELYIQDDMWVSLIFKTDSSKS